MHIVQAAAACVKFAKTMRFASAVRHNALNWTFGRFSTFCTFCKDSAVFRSSTSARWTLRNSTFHFCYRRPTLHTFVHCFCWCNFSSIVYHYEQTTDQYAVCFCTCLANQSEQTKAQSPFLLSEWLVNACNMWKHFEIIQCCVKYFAHASCTMLLSISVFSAAILRRAKYFAHAQCRVYVYFGAIVCHKAVNRQRITSPRPAGTSTTLLVSLFFLF